MDDARWFLALLNTGAFLLCVLFLVYVLLILRPFLRRGDTVPGDRRDVEFHFVLPCLNEEEVVEATVRHLAATFPYATLWVVDDASTDATGAVLARLRAELVNLQVVTRVQPDAQRGKGAALNAAWRAIDAHLPPGTDRERVVVGVLDADARLDRVCPDTICGPAMFGDPMVAAVQIQVRISTDVDALASTDPYQLSAGLDGGDAPRHREPLLVRLQDVEFTGTIAAMQVLRRRTGSVGMGGNGQFTRMAALDRIALEFGTPWHGALLEDFELGLHVLLTGMCTEYCDDTFVAQAGLTRVLPLIRQRSRWAQGGIQCSKYLWRVLTSSNVPLPAALEIAYYLYVPWSQIVGSVVFPAAILLDCYYALATAGGPARWWTAGAWGIAPLALLFGALPNAVWGPLYRVRSGRSVGRAEALLLGLANILYGYLLQVSVWWALVRVVRGRHDWKKTSHAAEVSGHRSVPAATPAATPTPALVPAPRTAAGTVHHHDPEGA